MPIEDNKAGTPTNAIQDSNAASSSTVALPGVRDLATMAQTPVESFTPPSNSVDPAFLLQLREAMDASLQQDWNSMAQQASDYCDALNTHFTDTVHKSLVKVDETRGELMNAYGQLSQAGVAYAKLDADVQVYQTTMEGKVTALRQYLGGEEAMRLQLMQDYRDMSTSASATAEELRTELATSKAKCQFLRHNEATLHDMLQLSEAHAGKLREAGNVQYNDFQSRENC